MHNSELRIKLIVQELRVFLCFHESSVYSVEFSIFRFVFTFSPFFSVPSQLSACLLYVGTSAIVITLSRLTSGSLYLKVLA